jgi:segregation and condensation protein B
VGVTQIDTLRGKPSGGLLSQLVRRKLVALERPAETPKQVVYRTTSRFLDLFGLDSLDDLPRSPEMGK